MQNSYIDLPLTSLSNHQKESLQIVPNHAIERKRGKNESLSNNIYTLLIWKVVCQFQNVKVAGWTCVKKKYIWLAAR